ncbi:hypothetical protein TrVE_jg156 [Triparma verrucosa]|uniref:Uncharacterized protein n=1 Tax=Triparma verrucosa TaxID=1606542 RepID=A0A9W7CID0_9STRA|nr:hypothetical protein TrVE_jg156 [Triparma verrucosa]
MISRETQIRHWLQKKKDEYYTTSRIAKLKEQLFLKTVSSNCQRNIVERIAEKGRGLHSLSRSHSHVVSSRITRVIKLQKQLRLVRAAHSKRHAEIKERRRKVDQDLLPKMERIKDRTNLKHVLMGVIMKIDGWWMEEDLCEMYLKCEQNII